MTSCFVLDASVAVAWLLPNEPKQQRATSLIQYLEWIPATVPLIFHFEVLQVLLKAERRFKQAPHVLAEQIESLRSLLFIVDPSTPNVLLPILLPPARRHRISIFDASYLALAKRDSLRLATFDGPLITAAAAEGVETLT